MHDDFELISHLTDVEIIAVTMSIRDNKKLKAQFGGRRWRKLKGIGQIRFPNGDVYRAELNWYEAHGIGRRLMKVKRIVE